MKYILMSGSFKTNEIPKKIINFLNRNLKKINSISFVTSTFEDYEKNDYYVEKMKNSFAEKNIKFENVYIIDSRLTESKMKRNINSSNIVFILGGNTLKQMEYINKYNLKNAIKNENHILIGVSAGAINMAKKVVLAKDLSDDIPSFSIYEGIGVSDYNIESHCDFNDNIHFKDLIEASFYTNLIVMNENCFIIINDKNKKIYGDYFYIKKGNIYYKKKKCNLDYFMKKIRKND